METLSRHLSFLAPVGSTSPFIGLFGTVWGIVNAFQSIAMTQNTSLTAVAPGIAEALVATAFGLVAAIPAVVAYNKFTSDLKRMAANMEQFAAEFLNIISRHIKE
jgi:biopolymer transport protein TolQ